MQDLLCVRFLIRRANEYGCRESIFSKNIQIAAKFVELQKILYLDTFNQLRTSGCHKVKSHVMSYVLGVAGTGW